MYARMENINLSNFRNNIEDFISQLVDSVLFDIPNDPVFVSYQAPQKIRMMSANSLDEIATQLEESRQFIINAALDKSTIALAVAGNNADKPHEQVFKKILRALVEKGLSRAEIRTICNIINFGAVEAFNIAKNDESAAIRLLENYKNILGEDNAPLMDDYLAILNMPDKSAITQLLPAYLESLITQQQVDLDTHHKKLRDEHGNDLTTEEIICPLTRQVINVERSRATQSAANQFLMLVAILAQWANVKSSQLDEFIAGQNKDYIQRSTELLQQYIQNPERLLFTKEQHDLLTQLGMNDVLQQWQAQKELSSPKKIQNSSRSRQGFFHLLLEAVDEENPYRQTRRNSM